MGVTKGQLSGEFDAAEKADLRGRVADAVGVAQEEVWACYSIIVFHDAREPDRLKIINRLVAQ